MSRQNKKHSGMALFIVLGFVMVLTPVILMLSRLGSAQVRQAGVYQQNLVQESVALAGMNSAMSRLRGDSRGYVPRPSETIGDHVFDLNIRPTGQGFFLQDLYYVFCSKSNPRRSFTIMADAEQFPYDGSYPVFVLFRHYWNTIEQYDISQVSDALAMQNFRGVELLALVEAREFEMNTTENNYRRIMLGKQVPDELSVIWPNAVENLVEQKMVFVPVVE